jgi:hypothetical protein
MVTSAPSIFLHRLRDGEGCVGDDPAAGRVEARFGLDALAEDGGGVIDLFVERAARAKAA